MQYITTFLKSLSFKSKSVIVFIASLSLMFTYQNCSKTDFGSMLNTSESLGVLSVCSLEDMGPSNVPVTLNGFGGIPLNAEQLRSVRQGSFLFFTISNANELDGAEWFIKYNEEAEVPMNPQRPESEVKTEKISYPNSPTEQAGLQPGNYRVRINVSKICENLNQNDPANVGLSKAQLAASSTLEKNIYVQFSVLDPASAGCDSLAGVFLNANDPKLVNTNVTFAVALPGNCSSLPIAYDFGDGSPAVSNGGASQDHSYKAAGQYAAKSRVGNSSTMMKKDLAKSVIILSECPKAEDMFLSGPGSVYIDRAGEYELQNYNNGSCNLNVNKVVFKRDSTVLEEDTQAPFKQSVQWSQSQVINPPGSNSVVAEVYLTMPGGSVSSTPVIVKKEVRVLPMGLGCSPDALANFMISGPSSALLNSSLTHAVSIPDCAKAANFSSSNDIEWLLMSGVEPGATPETKSLGKGTNITYIYGLAGEHRLLAKISNTKTGVITLSHNIRISNPPPPPPTNSCASTVPNCSTLTPQACTLIQNPIAPNQAWVKGAASCGFTCANGYSGDNCEVLPTCANGATNHPACTICPTGKSLDSSNNCVANSCAATRPGCSTATPATCSLTMNPTSVNQAWSLNAASCGFSCSNGYTGANCTTPPACTNGATNYPACTTCPTGQSLNGSNICTNNSCAMPNPVCSTSSPIGCSLVSNPTTINQTWAKGAASCGFSCTNGFSGDNCTTPPSTTCSNGANNYPTCTICPAGQSMNANNVCTNNSCAMPNPACSTTNPATCSLVQNPTSINQAWAKDAATCGFACSGGYSGPNCSVAPSCTNGATNFPTCTTCPTGQSFNSSNMCAANACSATRPTCSTTTPATCNLSMNPTSVNQNWVLNASSCGFACSGGYSGPNCTVPPACTNGATNYPTCNACPTGQSFNGSSCVANSCASPNPTCSSSTPQRCSLVTSPTSINQAWVKSATSCGFNCINNFTGANCETAPSCTNGATNYPTCSICAAGQSMNSNNVCTNNYCVSPAPGCSTTNPATCSLTFNPTTLNQGWKLNESSCGFACSGGYSGPNCTVAPTCTNGATNYPTCNSCPAGQTFNGSSCVANSCSSTRPGCSTSSPVTCSLVQNPTSINQNWVKDAASCGYSCSGGYSGPNCTVAPTCTNGATNYPTCNSCPAGQTFNGTSCVANSCSTSVPACYNTNPRSCNLAYNPTTINQAWTQNASSCGFTCANGYSGTNCSVAPTCSNGATNYPTCNSCPAGKSFNGTSCVDNACSTNVPACYNTSPRSCNLTYNPTSINQSWAQNASSCGFSCANGYSGTNCAVAPTCSNGATNYPTCSTCPAGQSINPANGVCAANSCSTNRPACSSSSPAGCNLTYNPTSVNQNWSQNSNSCGFSCANGYSGTNCSVAPTCSNGANNYPSCSTCPAGQDISPLTNRCEPIVSNRWCYKTSSGGPTVGYMDEGARHVPGCYHQSINQWFAVGSETSYNGYTIRCDSGPVGGAFPLPDSNCPKNTCGALSSSAQCTVTKVCSNGRRLTPTVGLVPNTANISGDYLQTVSVPQPQPSAGYSFTSWNANGNTLQMQCQNINNALQWKMVSDGFCTADYQMSATESAADPACATPDYGDGNWCAQSECQYDGQRYDNSVSCCYQTQCGYGGFGTCRQRADGTFYVEGLSCGRTQYQIMCK